MQNRKPPSDEEARKLRIIQSIIAAFEDCSLEQIATILVVAADPGLSVNDYARILQRNQNTMSMSLGGLATRRLGASGWLDMVEDPENYSRRQVYLASRGQRAITRVLTEFNKAG